MQAITLEIPEANVEFYIAALARGLLSAMKTGVIPTEVGIWSLGRPSVQRALESRISPELASILSEFDELDALQSLGGDIQGALDRLLNQLDECLRGASSRDTANYVIRATQQ
ncbi:hypothetical protein ACYCAX_10265 [Pseudomonas sp. MT3]